MERRYTVKEVAELAGISVRTLHHYDHIGLLTPDDNSDAGYRLYSDRNLERLQQILFFRELGFELKRIGEILDRPNFDEQHAMFAHRQLLVEKRDRLDQLIATVDVTIERMNRNEKMAENEMFNGFDTQRIEDQIEKYHEEAVELYGEEIVAESETKVRSMDPDQWSAVQQETDQINQNLANLMESHPADSAETQREIERWFDLLNGTFGTYTPEMFAGLGETYVADERFAAHYNRIRPGLAGYFRDAMVAFAERNESD